MTLDAENLAAARRMIASSSEELARQNAIIANPATNVDRIYAETYAAFLKDQIAMWKSLWPQAAIPTDAPRVKLEGKIGGFQ